MKKIKTQMDALKYYLKKHKSITSWEAIKKFGITRLSDKIYNLKKDGWGFLTEIVTTKNRYKQVVNYAKYHVVKEGK